MPWRSSKLAKCPTLASMPCNSEKAKCPLHPQPMPRLLHHASLGIVHVPSCNVHEYSLQYFSDMQPPFFISCYLRESLWLVLDMHTTQCLELAPSACKPCGKQKVGMYVMSMYFMGLSTFIRFAMFLFLSVLLLHYLYRHRNVKTLKRYRYGNYNLEDILCMRSGTTP